MIEVVKRKRRGRPAKVEKVEVAEEEVKVVEESFVEEEEEAPVEVEVEVLSYAPRLRDDAKTLEDWGITPEEQAHIEDVARKRGGTVTYNLEKGSLRATRNHVSESVVLPTESPKYIKRWVETFFNVRKF